MYGTPITVVGNVVDEVELRKTEGGLSRVSFRVASTQRRRDRESGQWVDGNKLFVKITFWREFADNVADSVSRGDPVIVYGHIFSRRYVKDAANRVSYEIEPEAIGHDLARGQAVFTRRRLHYAQQAAAGASPSPADDDDDLSYEVAAGM